MDALILRILKYREHYDSLAVDLPNDALHENTMTVIHAFGDWFKRTAADCIDVEDFKTYFFNFKKPKATSDTQRYYDRMIENCREDAPDDQVRLISEKLAGLRFATEVGNLVDRYQHDQEIEIIEEVGIVYDKALDVVNNNSEFQDEELDIEEILSVDEHREGIRFDTRPLCDGLRPLQNGDFIIVAGRPDSGKTSFLASQLTSFTKTLHSDRCVLWLNNEGTADRIIKRIYQSLLGAKTDDLLQFRRDGTLNQRYLDIVGDKGRIKVRDCHNWTSYQVEKAIKYYKPGLLIFDMIDNITFPGVRYDARTDQVLESMYQWARVLGVKYHFPVIATSQISADAEQSVETQCWPAQHMLKDSKTGKQGAADTIIMIGRSLDPTQQQYRHISTPKNKLAIGDSLLRATVHFDTKIGRYT